MGTLSFILREFFDYNNSKCLLGDFKIRSLCFVLGALCFLMHAYSECFIYLKSNDFKVGLPPPQISLGNINFLFVLMTTAKILS